MSDVPKEPQADVQTQQMAAVPVTSGATAAAGQAAAGGKAESLKTISGLLAVVAGLTALTIIALVAISVMNDNNSAIVSIASGSFGVIGTVVGAYFGVKAGNDSTQKAIDGTSKAIDGLKDESAKAQTFAAEYAVAAPATLAELATLCDVIALCVSADADVLAVTREIASSVQPGAVQPEHDGVVRAGRMAHEEETAAAAQRFLPALRPRG